MGTQLFRQARRSQRTRCRSFQDFFLFLVRRKMSQRIKDHQQRKKHQRPSLKVAVCISHRLKRIPVRKADRKEYHPRVPIRRSPHFPPLSLSVLPRHTVSAEEKAPDPLDLHHRRYPRWAGAPRQIEDERLRTITPQRRTIKGRGLSGATVRRPCPRCVKVRRSPNSLR